MLPRRALNIMVRKGGLEPPCLSAPPPQDGVSANFTTSAHWWRKAVFSIAKPLSRPGLRESPVDSWILLLAIGYRQRQNQHQMLTRIPRIHTDRLNDTCVVFPDL